MKTYTFWKENKLDQKYSLSLDEIKVKFIEWMKTKEKSWLDYYSIALPSAFVSDKEGLNSVMDDNQKLPDDLFNVKWDYLDSIGIK